MKTDLLVLSILFDTLLLGACSTNSVQREDVNAVVDEKIAQFCPLRSPTNEDRIKRAKIVLAAVAGYGYRSVQNYSRLSEVKDDSGRIISKLNDAYAQISITNDQIKSGLFPVYRADMIVELSEAAGAAISPTLRAAKRSVVAASVADRLATAKNALVGLLEDELYYSAYKEACQNFEKISDTSLNDRIRSRCNALSVMAGPGSMPCTVP